MPLLADSVREASIRTRCLKIISALGTATKTQIKDGAGITDEKFEILFGSDSALFIQNHEVKIVNGIGIHGECGYSLTDHGKELLKYYEWSVESSKTRHFFPKQSPPQSDPE